MSGWIQLHRKMREWEWFTDVNTCHLFLYCLLRANHKDTKWRGITIGRGQFITSLDTISKETGLSVMQVRTAIKKLELTKDITNESTRINRLITITNFNKYQDDNKPVNKRITNEQQTDNKRVTIDNNENNDNNDNNDNNIERGDKSPHPSKGKKGTRLKDDWDIPQEWGEWAVDECGWSVDKVIETGRKFKDHWLSVAGAKGVKLDWFATWRNWCRRTNEGF